MFLKLSNATLYKALALAALSATSFATTAHASYTTFSTGGTAATSSIQSTVDAFRAALGEPNNASNPGLLPIGRREINWDGTAAATATSNASPLTTFTNTRGATFTTAGTGFLQTPLADVALTSINANYGTTFSAFSAQRIFTATGSNVIDVTFFVPGSNGLIPATVGGFGAVFSDVDLPNISRLEFFNAANVQIQSFNVLPGTTASGSFSFLGAVATAGERIARVRITAGNSALGPTDTNGNTVDVVTMDDFIYSEPIVVPEPASFVLAGIAMLSIFGVVILRRPSLRLAFAHTA
jgi:hypothetical protein